MIAETSNGCAPTTAGFCPACLAPTEATGQRCGACDRPRPAAGWPRDPQLGRLIKSKYRLLARIGAGGFGQVFHAVQVQGTLDLGEVVIKLLLPEKAVDEESRRRFIDEARAARSVRSPHVVKVFDLDFDDDGVPFLVMEYLHGESLQRLLEREGRLATGRALRLVLQVAGALEECHVAGIVHRDLKPENLLLPGPGGPGEDFVKVLDFGVARVPSARVASTRSPLGTPRYMAPEQIRAEHVDAGADIFALGVIFYECLCGVPPILADTPDAYWRLNVDASPTPLREHRPDLPESLERLLGRMMAKRRVDRPPSMADVAQRLRAIGAAEAYLPADGAPARRGGASTANLDARRAPGSGARLPALRPSRWPLMLIAGVTFASLVALGVVVGRGGRETSGAHATTPVPCQPPTTLPGLASAPASAPARAATGAIQPAMNRPASGALAGTPTSRPTGVAATRKAARLDRARPHKTSRAGPTADDGWGRAAGGL